MFASGCLFWWPKAGADHLPRRLSCRGRMTLVFAGLPFELLVVIALMSYGKPVRSSGMTSSEPRAGRGQSRRDVPAGHEVPVTRAARSVLGEDLGDPRFRVSL